MAEGQKLLLGSPGPSQLVLVSERRRKLCVFCRRGGSLPLKWDVGVQITRKHVPR